MLRSLSFGVKVNPTMSHHTLFFIILTVLLSICGTQSQKLLMSMTCARVGTNHTIDVNYGTSFRVFREIAQSTVISLSFHNLNQKEIEWNHLSITAQLLNSNGSTTPLFLNNINNRTFHKSNDYHVNIIQDSVNKSPVTIIEVLFGSMIRIQLIQVDYTNDMGWIINAAENYLILPATGEKANISSVCNSMSNIYGYTNYLETFEEICYMVSGIVGIATTLLCFGSLIIFRKERLVSCRFIVPYMNNFLLFIYFCSLWTQSPISLYLYNRFEYVGDVARFRYKVVLYMFLSAALIAFSANILHMIRYYYTRNIYHLISMTKEEESDEQQRRTIVFHRKVTSKWTYSIILFSLSVVMVSLFILVSILLDVYKPSIRVAFVEYMTIVAIAVIILFATVTSLLDMIIHIKEIKRDGIRHYLTFQDPLLFRAENLFMVLTLVFAVGYGIVVAISPGRILAANRAKSLIIMCFLSLSYISVIMSIGGGLICIVSLKRMMEELLGWSRSDGISISIPFETEVERLLSDEQHRKLFEQYCKKEMSTENLKLYYELDKLSKSPSIDYAALNKIHGLYIIDSSPFQVNLSADTIRNMKTLHHQLKTDKVATVSFSTLNDYLRADLLANLSDTCSRFKRTVEFRNIVRKKHATLEITPIEFHEL